MKHTPARRSHSQSIQPLEPRRLLHGDVNLTFNFQPPSTGSVGTSIADTGFAYGDRGNGYAYGWSSDNRLNVRDRNMVSNQLLDTVAFMQNGASRSWELEVANGEYEVTIGSGDARYRDGVHDINVENTRVMYGIQSRKKQFLKATRTVTVTDGRLTVAPGAQASGAKINYITIKSSHTIPDPLPVVVISATDASATEDGDTGTIRVSRSGGNLTQPLTVSLAWSGSARGADIVSRPSSVTIGANLTSVDVTVTPIDDVLEEPLETAKAVIVPNNSLYTVGSATSASVLITGAEPDPEPLPTVSVSVIDNSATEGADTGRIRLTRTGEGLGETLEVGLGWTGSAGAGDVNRPSSVTFSANQATVDVVLTATDDSLDEATETATLTVSPSSAYNVGSPASGSVLIEDNDAAPQLTNITWSAATAPPISFSESTSVVLNGKIYLFGGFNGAFVPQKNVYSFDGTSWTTHANSPKAFTHVGHAAVSDSVAWFAGGYIGNNSGGQIFGTTEVFTYDATTDTWGNAPALPAARAGGNLVKVGRSVYYFGGENFNRTADMNTMWALDLDNQNAGWVQKSSMPLARNHASALEVNGKIYAIAGQTGYDNGSIAEDDIQIYDPATNTWTVASQKLPAARSHTSQSAFFHEGQILLITGALGHNQPVNTVWSIDPTTLTTSSFTNFPQSRFSVACAILNNQLYAYGGYNGTIPQNAYVGTFVLS